MSNAYPDTVIEILDGSMEFPPKVIAAVQRFAEAGPWRGSLRQRKRKFRQLVLDLSVVYGIAPPALDFEGLNGSHSGQSYYDRRSHRILLSGRLSVVTVLHEFCHARGMNEHDACRWSVNLFRRCFPRQYGRLVHVGHVLLRPADLRRRPGLPPNRFCLRGTPGVFGEQFR